MAGRQTEVSCMQGTLACNSHNQLQDLTLITSLHALRTPANAFHTTILILPNIRRYC